MNSIASSSFLLTFLLGGAIFIGLFMMLFLLKSKSLKASRFFLGFALFFMILQLGTYLLFTTQLIKHHPHLLGLSYPTLFLIGPFFFFFVRSFNNDDFKFRKVDLVHLIPFLYVMISTFSFYLESSEYKASIVQYYYEHIPSGQVNFTDWLQGSLYMLIVFAYVVWVLFHLYKNHPSGYPWLKRVAWVMLILSISYMTIQSGILLSGASAITAEIILSGLLAVAILILGYWILDINSLFPATVVASYKTSSLSNEKLAELERKLITSIEKDRYYLDSKLKIATLSSLIDIPKHHISQVLNEQMNSNFYDFINKYRVEEAKRLLLNGVAKKLSIQAIGEECGFSNKTTFYRSFKKFTGTTPNEFLQS